MADRDFAVRATKVAAASIDGLRGKARRSYEAFEAELRKQGCRVAGYRLLADDGGYSLYCCKRLVEDWRAITTFEPGIAIVIALGRHDERGFYASLAKTLEVGPVGRRRAEKPGCCGEDGWPTLDPSPAGPAKCREALTGFTRAPLAHAATRPRRPWRGRDCAE